MPKKRPVLDAGTLTSPISMTGLKVDLVLLREKSIKFVFRALITSLTETHQFRIALQTDWRRATAISGSE